MEARFKLRLSSVLALSWLLFLAFVSVTLSEETEWREDESVTPRWQIEVCKRQCKLEEEREHDPQWKCVQRCQEKHGGGGKEREKHREEEREREKGDKGRHGNQIKEQQEQVQEQGDNPYYFHEQRFQSRFKSEEGQIRVLEKFHQRTELLKGLKTHRFAVIEAKPKTFITPHHLDADAVLVFVRGKARISLVWQEKKDTKRESYNVESGDIVTLPGGITFYAINHGNENLQIVKLLHSVNSPGEFKEFFAAGGENQGYYSVFSNEVLEAALNIPSDQIERALKKRRERGVAIIRASEEQLRALSKGDATSTRKHGDRGTTSSLIKLQSQSPVYSNQFGQMYEASPDDFPQLWITSVAAVNIKQGGMMVPHYNSRATWIVFVGKGNGTYEIACPHLRSGERTEQHGDNDDDEREGKSGEFRKITGSLTPGGVLVVPAGHPVVLIASQYENLELVGFGLHGDNNHRNFLAGKENIMNEVEPEAKGLIFYLQGKEADEFFRKQKQSFFTQGPQGGRRTF